MLKHFVYPNLTMHMQKYQNLMYYLIYILSVSDSETTDPVSLEDTSDDDNSGPSGPSTPLEDLPKPATRVYL